MIPGTIGVFIGFIVVLFSLYRLLCSDRLLVWVRELNRTIVGFVLISFGWGQPYREEILLLAVAIGVLALFSLRSALQETREEEHV